MRRLIISDLHIGSLFSREDDIVNLLKKEKYDELILGGDIIEFIKIPKFTKKSLEIFNILLNITVPIIYLIGNHDVALNEFIDGSINNITFKKQYNFVDNDKKIRIEHGDDYDFFYIKWEQLMNFICIISNIIERYLKIDLTKIFNYFININSNITSDIKVKKIASIIPIIKKNRDVDIFIMGHTHKPEILHINNIHNKKNDTNKYIIYCNSGDWVQHKSYIILENGNVTLHNL